MGLRIAFCNLLTCRTTSLDKLIDRLNQQTPDLVMVSGFRTGLEGMVLRANFDRMCLVYQTPCDSEPDQDALIVASRFPIQNCPLPHRFEAFRDLWVHVLVGRYRLLGIDSPTTALRQPFNAYLQDNMEKWQSDNTLMFCGYPCAEEDAEVLAHAPAMAALIKTTRFIDVRHQSREQYSADPSCTDMRTDLTPCQAWITPGLSSSLVDLDLNRIEDEVPTSVPSILSLRLE